MEQTTPLFTTVMLLDWLPVNELTMTTRYCRHRDERGRWYHQATVSALKECFCLAFDYANTEILNVKCTKIV